MEFYRDKNKNVIEGFLGDSCECEILFILREPNNNGEEPKEFWFKKVLLGEVTNGKRYLRTLGRLYNVIYGHKDMSDKVFVENLKKCCYINLHPHFGHSRASEAYADMLKNFEENRDKASHNRWEVIDDLIDKYGCKNIVTVGDIFSVICLRGIMSTDAMLGYGDKTFRSCKYKGVSVYEFYHPSYPMSYNKISIRGKL